MGRSKLLRMMTAAAAVLFLSAAAQGADNASQSQDIFQNDNMVYHFAKAYMELQPVWNETDTKLTQANSDAERKRINDDSTAQQAGIIKSEGLTVEQFNQFIDKVNTDPQFKARVKLILSDIKAKKYSGGSQ